MIGGRAISYVRETAAWQLPLLGTVEPWQKVFFLVGLPGMLVVPVLLLTVREPLRRGLWKGSGSPQPGRSVSIPMAEVFRYMRQKPEDRSDSQYRLCSSGLLRIGNHGLASGDVPAGPWLGNGSVRA